MKIIEKKCPNCGAKLNFDSEDTETKCNYCGQEFIIENDHKEKENPIAGDFTLQKKLLKTFGVTHLFVSGFIILVAVIIFAFVFFSIFKQISGNKIDISLVENDTLEMINSSSIDFLTKMNSFNTFQNINVKYEPVGIYLYEDSFGNNIVDVIKCTYNVSGEENIVYGVVKYRNVKIKDDTVTLNYNGTVDNNTILLNDNIMTTAFGYRTLEEVYNKAVLNFAKGKIQSKGSVYNPE